MHACPLNDLLWERIGEVLKERGETYAKLWRKVRRDKNTYTNWIRRRTIPKVSDLQQLAEALETPAADLLSTFDGVRPGVANAERTAEKMRALMVQYGPRVIVLECSGIADMEYTALLMLTEAEQNLRARGLELWLAAINPELLKIIERSPLAGQLGRSRMFYDLHLALQSYLARGEAPSRPARTDLA